MSQPISQDTQLLRLDSQLRELQERRRRTRPALQFFFAIVFAGLFILFFGSAIVALNLLAIGSGVVAIVALLAGVAAIVRVSRLNGEIEKVKAQIRQIEGT